MKVQLQKKILPSSLDYEFRSSEISSQYNGMKYLSQSNELELFLEGDVEQKVIDGIIEDHDSVHYKVYNIAKSGKTIHAYDIDYNILGLKKERVRDKGELLEVRYWKNYNDGVFSDLFVKEKNTYHKIDGYIQYREKKICWFDVFGEEYCGKTTYKYYTPQEAATAGVQRRTNILNDAKVTTVGLISETELITVPEAESLGFPFLDKYTREMQQFRDGNTHNLIDAITIHDTSTMGDEWLDNEFYPGVTVRMGILGVLNYND